MSGNLLPLFLNPTVTANGTVGVSGSARFGSKPPMQFDSNFLFGSLLNQAMNAKHVPRVARSVANAAFGAYPGGANGVSDLGSLFLSKIAAKLGTNAAGLQAQFQQMLANGQSLQSIIAQLASQLAGEVSDASSLENGSSGITARNRLMQAFSQALAPPGKAPTDAATQAAALAQRFVQVANIVAGAAQSQDVGQQYRYPGISLDANSAKVSPAPDATQTDPAVTASALVSSMQANLMAALPAQSSGLPPTTSSGVSPLQARLSALLAGGAPTDAVVKTLASNLGNTVALASGADNATTAGLQAAFARRLSVPAGATPDHIAAQLAAQATAIVQQAAAQITGGATAGQAVTALAPSVASTPGGTDVLQRILQRAQNATVVAGGTAQPQSATQSVSATSGQGGTNTAGNGNANVNLNALFAQAAAPEGGSSAQTSVDAFLANFTQAMTDLRSREDSVASASVAPVDSPANGTQAFLASIGSVDPAQNTLGLPVAPIAAPNPTDPNNVVEQVLKGIYLRNGIGDGTEVRMKLQPENLGDVHVKLNVDNGNVSATFIASTAEVRDTLLANSGALTRQFADAGLKLQQFSVDVGGGQSNPFAQHQQQASSGGASMRSMTTSADDDVVDGIQAAVPTFGPPILSGLNRGLLDYLV